MLWYIVFRMIGRHMLIVCNNGLLLCKECNILFWVYCVALNNANLLELPIALLHIATIHQSHMFWCLINIFVFISDYFALAKCKYNITEHILSRIVTNDDKFSVKICVIGDWLHGLEILLVIPINCNIIVPMQGLCVY